MSTLWNSTNSISISTLWNSIKFNLQSPLWEFSKNPAGWSTLMFFELTNQNLIHQSSLYEYKLFYWTHHCGQQLLKYTTHRNTPVNLGCDENVEIYLYWIQHLNVCVAMPVLSNQNWNGRTQLYFVLHFSLFRCSFDTLLVLLCTKTINIYIIYSELHSSQKALSYFAHFIHKSNCFFYWLLLP